MHSPIPQCLRENNARYENVKINSIYRSATLKFVILEIRDLVNYNSVIASVLLSGTYVSTGNSGTVRFVSDGSIQRGGFKLLLTSFHTGACTASEFLCDTDR